MDPEDVAFNSLTIMNREAPVMFEKIASLRKIQQEVERFSTIQQQERRYKCTVDMDIVVMSDLRYVTVGSHG